MSMLTIATTYLKRVNKKSVPLNKKNALSVGKLRLNNFKVFTGLCKAFKIYPVREAIGVEFEYDDYANGSKLFTSACQTLITYLHYADERVTKSLENTLNYVCIPSGENNVGELDTSVPVLSTVAVEGGFIDEETLSVVSLEVSKLNVIFVNNFHAYAKLTEFFLLAGQQMTIVRVTQHHTLEELIQRHIKNKKKKLHEISKAKVLEGAVKEKSDIEITINDEKYVDRGTVELIAKIMRKASKGARTLSVEVKSRREQLELERR